MYTVLVLFMSMFVENALSECTARAKSAEQRLREKLFCSYDKKVRPVLYSSNQTNVFLQLYPSRIYLTDHEEVFTVHGTILYHWQDDFLTWDKREFEGIDSLLISSDDIWVPDITIEAQTEARSMVGRMDSIMCQVNPNGVIYCSPLTTIHTHCTPDFRLFPFDIQNCSIVFASYGYLGHEVNFGLFDPNKGIHMGIYRPNKIWKVTQTSAVRLIRVYPGEDNATTYHPYIRYTFILQRHSGIHQLTTVVPAIVLATLTLTTFWMDSNYSNRIYLSGTTIISCVLYLQFLGYWLPPSGDSVPLIASYFRDLFILSMYAIIAAVLTRKLRSRSDRPYNWLVFVVDKVQGSYAAQVLMENTETPGNEEDMATIIETSQKKITPWGQAAVLLDRISFFLCSIIFFGIYLIDIP